MLPDPPHPRHFLPLLVLFASCAGLVNDFTKGRSLDPCSGSNYPLCDSVASCILDNTNFLRGHFPGDERQLVRTTGPATVQLHFLLENVSSAGQQTLLTWYEPGCSSPFQLVVLGTVFVGEAEQTGEFVRSYDLLAAGDHQITYQSDANADYYFKVEIIPK
jgi:hypothetical protein